MKKPLSIPAAICSLIMTLAFVWMLNEKKTAIGPMATAGILFFLGSLIIFTFLLRTIGAFIKIYRLKGVKLNSYAYWLYPVSLIVSAAAVFIILFRSTGWTPPQYLMSGSIILSVILLIICQLGGAFPDIREGDRKTVIRHENAGSFPGGFEILGSMTGKSDGSIIIGLRPIPTEGLTSMHRSEDAVIIEGTDRKKTEIVLLSDKSKKFFSDLLGERLRMPEKQVKKGLNFRPQGKNEIHFKNREQRRREKREREKQ